MSASADHVVGLIFGRWRGQILHAGTALGVFDHLTQNHDTAAPPLAPTIGADPALLYRLLRGLAAIGVLAENDVRGPYPLRRRWRPWASRLRHAETTTRI
jgi:DNA-binding IclR family transcriptional regulator